MKIIVLFSLLFALINANSLDFSLIKKGQKQDSNVLLVIGGIQGDEPGGFNAATLLATHYEITKGSVWIVPNLNFYSIVERSRGPYGDMNRKFAYLPKTDPEYHIVQSIKNLILDKSVDMIVNLHDGSGFYREKWINKYKNPYRWGQSCIVDQTKLENIKYGNLEEIATSVKNYINQNIINKEHIYGVKNTKTKFGDKEMEKSLTYFAIKNGKSAYANEASKSFGTSTRAYYHLLALEKYMQIMGIEYKRKFNLTPQNVKSAINDSDLQVVLYENKLLIPIRNARKNIYFFPIKKNKEIKYQSDNPLVAITPKKNRYRVSYGNNRMANLYPEFLDYDYSLNKVEMDIDGKIKEVPFGAIVKANDNFTVKTKAGYRTNVIGFYKRNLKNESHIKISEKDIKKRYSVDKKGKIFRIEIYKDKKFSGMILVNFDKKSKPKIIQKIALQKEFSKSSRI